MKENLLATIYAQEEENESQLPIVSLELFF